MREGAGTRPPEKEGLVAESFPRVYMPALFGV